VKIGETKLEGMKDLVGALSHLSIGDEVSLQFVRNGASYETKLRLREAPEKLVARRR
jgi:S1-C subfamily serine protease